MNYAKYLTLAGVPESLHSEAIAALDKAKVDSKGLFVKKFKVRLFKNKKISELLTWEDNRLIDKHPELAEWDIAPITHITCNGDSIPWKETPEGGRPLEQYWLNTDTNSEDYHNAIAANYWLEGTHPRSPEAREAWYRRNAGEYVAYRLGVNIDYTNTKPVIYEANGVEVWNVQGAWLLKFTKRVAFLKLNYRVGYEIDNTWSRKYDTQAWFPIKGYTLKAPVTWSVKPSF
jgi:hypothetical protein